MAPVLLFLDFEKMQKEKTTMHTVLLSSPHIPVLGLVSCKDNEIHGGIWLPSKNIALMGSTIKFDGQYN